MDNDEAQAWFTYFNDNPPGLEEDYRAYSIMKASSFDPANIPAPAEIFRSYQILADRIERDKELKEQLRIKRMTEAWNGSANQTRLKESIDASDMESQSTP